MKTFRTKNGLQNYIRKNGTGKLNEFKFEQIEWFMENYDLEGRSITYRAKEPDDNFIEITTSDRYGINGFKNAVVEVYSPLTK